MPFSSLQVPGCVQKKACSAVRGKSCLVLSCFRTLRQSMRARRAEPGAMEDVFYAVTLPSMFGVFPQWHFRVGKWNDRWVPLLLPLARQVSQSHRVELAGKRSASRGFPCQCLPLRPASIKTKPCEGEGAFSFCRPALPCSQNQAKPSSGMQTFWNPSVNLEEVCREGRRQGLP